MTLALAPLERDVRLADSPAHVYLATLAPSGRRAQAVALWSVARILAPRLPLLRFPWAALRYQHVAVVREALVERGYAPATVNRWLAALRGVLRQAWLLGLVSIEDYHRAKEVPKVPGSRLPRGRCLDVAEVRALLDVAGPRDRAAFSLLYGAGLRVAEAVGLDVSHLDLPHRLVRVLGKGNKEREVPLAPFVLAALERWLAERGGWNGPLFPAPDGWGRLHPNSLGSALERRLAQASAGRATPHDLRRTFATLLLDRGEDLDLVRLLMGHADPRTTAGYDRRPLDRKWRAVDGLAP